MKILVLSRNYPNVIMPTSGIWVEQLVCKCNELAGVHVVAPVPYSPPLPEIFHNYTRHRTVPKREVWNGVPVHHPRFLLGPGYALHFSEALSYYLGIRNTVESIWEESQFDIIHAHFGYPDGAVAARLGRKYNVPVIITDHAFWDPWMVDYPSVRRQAVHASHQSTFHVAVSQSLKESIVAFTGDSDRYRVIGLGTDPEQFTLPGTDDERHSQQLLYVGYINHTKGIDILLQAMRKLVDRYPSLRLKLIGGGFYQHKSRQEDVYKALAEEMELLDNVEFAGIKSPEEVASSMRESTMLVSSSRRETFGVVLVEALASGLPVVATRCGGPEEIVTAGSGELVPTEDPTALAEAIDSVLQNRESFDARTLRAYARENYSWEAIARQYMDLYEEAIEKKKAKS